MGAACRARRARGGAAGARGGRTGARGGSPGPKAASLLSIGDPDIDFVAIANGMGVSATRATTAAAFNAQLEAAINTPGPHLIDALVPTLF